MFETSVVSARIGSQKKRRAGLLTVSLIAHSAVILGTIGVSIASVNFPQVAPDEYRTAPLFATVQIPPPLGNPNGGAKPQAAPVEKPKTPQPPPPNQITAPSAVPDEVIPAQSTSTNNADSGNSTEGDGRVEGPIGVPWGDPNSVSNDLTLPPAVVEAPVAEARIYEAHEVKAPVLLRKVEPKYPQSMIRVGMNSVVVVRCIIDKNGNVRDPQILTSSMPPFNTAVVNAVQQWKFTPGSLRGDAVETYLTLTVNFNVKR